MMLTDPRLRLLEHGPQNALARQILETLDDTRIVVHSGADVTGASTSALAAFIAIAARLFGDVRVVTPVPLVPNWWGARDTTELLADLAPVLPRTLREPTQTVTVTFGEYAPAGDFGVGGDDYTLRLAREPQPVGGCWHALGLHAASCLAVSQLLVRVLGPLGYPGVALDGPYVMNLLDYRLAPAPDLGDVHRTPAPPMAVALAGVGSVGTSTAALLATALAPALGLQRGSPGGLGEFLLIDADDIDPGRNPFRYPALTGREVGNKAIVIAQRLIALGLPAQAAPVHVANWMCSRPTPGYKGLLVSSVDTLSGRMDVTDVLAWSTLSLGVAGLALHAQRELFADDYACSFCDYVSAVPPSTQAGVYAQATGLSVARVLALLQPGARLNATDIDTAIAAGHLPAERRDQLIGSALSDLVRQAYAEAAIRSATADHSDVEVIGIAAPQVSWFAGVLAAVEVTKQLQGLPLLDRRVDVDLSGLPPGLVRRIPADRTGRCLCHSGVRRRWYRDLYPLPIDLPPHQVSTAARGYSRY